ncbi:glycosyltransferase [Wenzhouxiangella limi]|uniref:Glycosyltransferase n=1 Tax=Wenzhouxiangella limi TaxID=2707351 RepID=A0A845V1T7_9GAMM|nr:glycosyltransferase [Wenzhouxiangella limi]NDY95226.1 glycosyltransferase [Wenzhouxiangella limi]
MFGQHENASNPRGTESTKLSEWPRLLVLASTYPRWPGDHEPGFVHQLSRRLTDLFKVRVLTPHHAGAARQEQRDGVDVRRYRYAPEQLETLIYDGGMVTNLRRQPLKWLLVPLFFLAQLWATWRQVRTWRPDVIHAHWLIPQGLMAAMLAASPRFPPFLVTSHGADLHALRFWPMPALKRFVARRAAGFCVVSWPMFESLEKNGFVGHGALVESTGLYLRNRFLMDLCVVRLGKGTMFFGRGLKKKNLRYRLDALHVITKALLLRRWVVSSQSPLNFLSDSIHAHPV